MKEKNSIEIDTPFDLMLAKKYIQKMKNLKKGPLSLQEAHLESGWI